uniref:Uncharacterized protein n=1 Tax=Romanomermis culicivorax TaxID=13658 RepID=A0A915KQ93_ROMCU
MKIDEDHVVTPAVRNIDIADVGVAAALIVGDSAVIDEGVGENGFQKP